MTFPARLGKLISEDKKYRGWDTYGNLSAYLVKHAEAIRDLVVAAELYSRDPSIMNLQGLRQALAKLEEHGDQG